MNLVTPFLRQVQERPAAIALIETRHGREQTITYRELEEASQQMAGMFRTAGLQPGDGVLTLVPVSIALYITLIALFRQGLVAVVFDAGAGREHILKCCAAYPLQGFVGIRKAHLLRLLHPPLRAIPDAWTVGGAVPGARRWEDYRRAQPVSALQPVGDDAPALVTFTSGGSGRPKAALRTHGFLLAQHRVLASSLEHTPGEVDLTTLPIFGLANLASGLTSLLPDADLRSVGQIDPIPVHAQMRRWRPATLTSSPAFLERLIAPPDHAPLQSLQRVYTGGAPVFPHFLRRLRQALPAARLIPVYGSTEAEPIAEIEESAITTDDWAAMEAGNGLLAGKPVDDIALRVIHDQTGTPLGPWTADELQAVTCKPEEPGEIIVMGEHVLTGYLHGAGDSENKIRIGNRIWHRTGDCGYLDGAGRLWLLGRGSATIQDDRGSLYPFAVECAALSIAGVQRAAVIQWQGQRLLVIEPVPGSALAPAALRGQLAWAELDAVRLVKRLPLDRRHNAKVDYPALRRMLK